MEVIKEAEGQEVHDTIWNQMRDLIVKTLIMALPHLDHNYRACRSRSSSENYRQCFEILGFDIMLDKKLKPWLLEVNDMPSFNDDTEVDKRIKTGLIEDTFRLLDIRKNHKYRMMEK